MSCSTSRQAAVKALNMSRQIDPDAAEPSTLLARIYHEKKDFPAERLMRGESERLTGRKRSGYSN